MECKFCHAVIEDDAQFCPLCGKSLIEEAAETPAEEPVAETEAAVEEVAAEETAETEEAAEETSVEGAEDVPAEEVEETPAEDAEETPAEDTEDAAEEPVEEEAVPETPKKRHGVLFAILGVLLAAIIAGAVYLSQQAKIPAERVTLSGATSYTVENGAMTQETADRVVASSKKNNLFEQAKTMLGATAPAKDGLTNAQLALFYWENFYNYYNQNYYYAMYLGLDPQNMATSMYDEEANRTWQEYFLSNALEDYRTYTAACAKAKAEKFEIPAEIAENLKTIRDSIAERSDEELNEQLLSVYGPGVDREDYLGYLEKLFLGSSYIQSLQEKIEPTDEDLSAFYDAHAEEYADIPKDDTGTVNVRHILISPTDENEAAWTAAEEKAQSIYKKWQENEPTEESFSALAGENSEDPGSVENGGLYENVYPGQMVEAFDNWCFDPARKSGDHGVVKTDYGFHIMYFVSAGEDAYWKTAVRDACTQELVTKAVDEIALTYNLRLDLSKIALATPGQILETPTDAAVEDTANAG